MLRRGRPPQTESADAGRFFSNFHRSLRLPRPRQPWKTGRDEGKRFAGRADRAHCTGEDDFCEVVSAPAICLKGKSELELPWQTGSPALVAVSGANFGDLLEAQRLSSSKGQSQRKLATQSDRPWLSRAVVAALPKGWTPGEIHRPSHDLRRLEAARSRPLRGRGYSRCAGVCSALFPPHFLVRCTLLGIQNFSSTTKAEKRVLSTQLVDRPLTCHLTLITCDEDRRHSVKEE